MTGLPARLMAAIIAVPVILIACAVFATASIESDSALHAAEQQTAGQALLTAMLDQETGARGYFQTGDLRFLQPYWSGQAALRAPRCPNHERSPVATRRWTSHCRSRRSRTAIWLRSARAQIDRLERTGIASQRRRCDRRQGNG